MSAMEDREVRAAFGLEQRLQMQLLDEVIDLLRERKAKRGQR